MGFEMGWYAVRTVYHFGKKSDETNVFEERIGAIEAPSFEEALQKADDEAAKYEQAHGFTAHEDQMAYEQDGDDLIVEYEIWSQLFEACLSLDEFYAERYARFDYHPEKFRQKTKRVCGSVTDAVSAGYLLANRSVAAMM
jgi:hypothetical protein